MEQWTKEQFEQYKAEGKAALYVYTPMCGTCQVASRMMEVVKHLVPHRKIGALDLNFEEQLAMTYEIESVPCLLIVDDGKITEKVYAFQSVPYLYELLKN
ncbi:MAG TPA: thioredoxin family protein [Metalysinibacillus sp.]